MIDPRLVPGEHPPVSSQARPAPVDDRSMRALELVTASIALVAAILLAVAR